MISPAMVAEIRRLLLEGRLSQRKIARATGISRATVQAIASGRRPDYPAREPDEHYLFAEGPPQRCRGCGGMVYQPCHLCRVRAHGATQDCRAQPGGEPCRVERPSRCRTNDLYTAHQIEGRSGKCLPQRRSCIER